MATIRWTNQSPLTDNSVRSVMSAYGNLAKAGDSLAQRINSGLEQEILRRDLNEKKISDRNTQHIINRLHNIQNASDLEALRNSGGTDFNRLSQDYTGGFDQRAVNQAIAQLEAGVNNRWQANDALKISNPETQQAYRQYINDVATGNRDGILGFINNENTPLALLPNAASSYNSIVRQQIEQNRMAGNDELAKLELGAAHSRRDAALLTDIYENSLLKNGYKSMSQLSADMRSDNENSRTKANAVFNSLPENFRATFINPDGSIDHNRLSRAFDLAAAGGNLFQRNPQASTINPNNAGEPVRQAVQQSIAPQNNNVLPAQNSFDAVVNNIVSRADNNQSTVANSNVSMPRTSEEVLLGLNTLNDNNADINAKKNIASEVLAYRDSLGTEYPELKEELDAVIKQTGFDPKELKSNNYRYNSALQNYQSKSVNEQRTAASSLARDQAQWKDLVNTQIDNTFKFEVSPTQSIPMRQLVNPQIDEEQKPFADRTRDLLKAGSLDTAERKFKSQFKEYNAGLDRFIPSVFNATFVDQMWDNIRQDFLKNRDPNAIYRHLGLFNYYKNQTNSPLTSWGMDSPESQAILRAGAALRNTSKEDFQTVKENIDRFSKTATLPLESLHNVFDPRRQGSLDARFAYLNPDNPIRQALQFRASRGRAQEDDISERVRKNNTRQQRLNEARAREILDNSLR